MNAELFELGKWLYLLAFAFLLAALAVRIVQKRLALSNGERAWSTNQKRKFINKIK